MAAAAENIAEPGQNLPQEQVNSGAPAVNPDGTVRPVSDVNLDDLRGFDLAKERFRGLSKGKQVQMMVALALGLTLLAVLIAQLFENDYKLLYGNLSEKASSEVVGYLESQGIDFKLDEKTGEVQVPSSRIHDIRLKLAAQGLPNNDGQGFELLDESQGFGTSQFIENARFHRALEGELARTIKGMENIESARVHLAIPKQSVFIRDKKEPSASVMLHVRQAAEVNQTQIAAIVHLVASSVPELKSDKVTVVDQAGKMLTKSDMGGEMGMSTAQFDYRQKLEKYYIQRIENILTPITGFNSVRAQVDADIDFTSTESTQESFNPDLPAVRSEQTMEEESRGGDLGGVPGALTNQPPGGGVAPETIPGNENGSSTEGPTRRSKKSTFNYELDKTISHTKRSPGQLKRLTVAVVVDDKLIVGADNSVSRVSYTPEELDRINSLVRDAVGFSIQRGDSVNVINQSFLAAQEIPEPEMPLWEQPWFIELMKQAGTLLAAVLVIYLLLKPVIAELTFKEEIEEDIEMTDEEKEEYALLRRRDKLGLTAEEWATLGMSAEEYEQMLSVLRKMVIEDPRLVAQVIKTWITAEEIPKQLEESA